MGSESVFVELWITLCYSLYKAGIRRSKTTDSAALGIKSIQLLHQSMSIQHSPELEPRQPREGDLELFKALEPRDAVMFFEWPVEPLTVVGREDDESVGERVRVKSEGDESFLYEIEGNLWHYVPEDTYAGENNPFPVQDLSLVESADVE